MSSPSLPARIAVALIEDNRLVREGLTALINRQPGLRVVVQQAPGAAWSHVGDAPQVVLLDIGLRKADSLRIAAKVRSDLPAASRYPRSSAASGPPPTCW